MQPTLVFVDGVAVFRLADAGLDARKQLREPMERKELERLINSIPIANVPPVLVDLRRLTVFGGLELQDLLSIISKAVSQWGVERLIVIADRPQWQQKIHRSYPKVQIFTEEGEAIRAAVEQNQALKLAG